MEALLADRDNDAVLVMNVPTALASASDAAKAVAAAVREHRNRYASAEAGVRACGSATSGDAPAKLEAAGIPHYRSETDAVRGFMHLVRYREASERLMATPPSLPQDFAPDVAAARAVMRGALSPTAAPGSIRWRSRDLFAAYAIPIAPAVLARDAGRGRRGGDAAPRRRRHGRRQNPVARYRAQVRRRRRAPQPDQRTTRCTRRPPIFCARARAAKPDARITGVTVHPMIVRPKARELIAGIADDPTFGPVVVFGSGGTAVEVINDKALALPPLDLKLAHDLIARTRISRLLKAYRNVPAADVATPSRSFWSSWRSSPPTFPKIREIDLNPLLADETGVIAVDARVAVAPVEAANAAGPSGNPRFAIRPYPKEWERRHRLAATERAILVRPVRPEDEALYPPFLAACHARKTCVCDSLRR